MNRISRHGFTLVEVLVALAVVSIALNLSISLGEKQISEDGSGGNFSSLHQHSPLGLHSKSSFGISFLISTLGLVTTPLSYILEVFEYIPIK